MRVRTWTSHCWLLLSLASCGEAAPEPELEPEITYYRDIKPVLDAYCVECHRVGGVAPFALDSHETVSAVAPLIPDSVESRQMPPFLAAPAVRPLRFDTSLSDAQIELISAWIELGAPMGDPEDEGPAIELPVPSLERIDVETGMDAAYTPTQAPDEYRCFVLDWPASEPGYITGLEYFGSNESIAHHAVVYLVDEQFSDTIDAADGADGQPGYSCFGGASPDGEPSFPARLLAGWGPGTGASVYPEGTGNLVLPDTRIVLQMHYSILASGSQPDQTRIAFQLEDSVQHDAGSLPLLDPNWPADPTSMLIPAGEKAVSYEHLADPTASPLLGDFVPGLNPSEGIYLYALTPHMHKLGEEISVKLERSDGSVEPLIEITNWDFEWQREYTLEEPVLIEPGDQLRMRCTWDNSAENQPVIQGERREPEDVIWGEGTFDEMCVTSVFVRGVAAGDESCEELGSVPANQGRLVATFDATASVRESAALEGELRGMVVLSVFRDEDVSVVGPKEGAEAVASITLDEVDIRTGPSAPILLDALLPAGQYQLLGFMDTDANADPASPSPDAYDPVLIPSVPHTVACDTQPTTLNFALLLPP